MEMDDMEKNLLDAAQAGERYGMASVPVKKDGIATFAQGHKDVWKMLRYDVEALVVRGGLLTIMSKGTICTLGTNFVLHLMRYPVFSFLIFLLTNYLVSSGIPVESKYASDLVKNVTKVTPFILGLYVSLSVSRWWALRTSALGQILDSTSNINMLITILAPADQHQPSRDMVFRWTFAGVHLVVKAARNIDTIDDLVADGYLSKAEAGTIAQVPPFQRAMVAWAWVGRAVREAQQRGVITGPFLGQMTQQVLKARDGIENIKTYLDTQLPFAYVHLITLMVSLTNFATGFKCCRVLQIGIGDRGDETKRRLKRSSLACYARPTPR